MKNLSDTECDLLIQQSGFQFQKGITGDKLVSTTQMLSIADMHRIVRHTFIVGQEHAANKINKKRSRTAD